MASDEPRGNQGGYNSGGGDRNHDRERERDRGRERERELDRDRNRDRDSDREYDRNRDRSQRRGPPRCFKCHKKKAKELAKQKAEEEKIEREQRVARKEAKARKAEERELKLAKNVDMQLSLKIGELRDEIRQELRRVMTGKSKAKSSSGVSGSGSSGDSDGGSEDLSARTKQLTISEKRKRGVEPVFEDSPPTVVPPKRTPRRRSGIKRIRLTPRLKSCTPKVKSRSTTKPKSRQASNMKIPAERGDHDGYRSGGGVWDRDRDRDRYRAHDWDRDQDRGRKPSSDRERERERGQRCGPPGCFRCQRVGHYANQCSWFDAPRTTGDSQRARSSSPRRGFQGQSSSSGESRRTPELEKLERNVASLQEYIQLERAKKDEKEARKKAKALAKQREEEGRLERERSIAKKIEKEKRAEEKQLELAKSVDTQLFLKIGELRDEIRQELRRAIKGKNKAKSQTSNDEESGNESDDGTNDLNIRTGQLTINEKRKRGEEPVFEDSSPPMIVPPKRTPTRHKGMKEIKTPRSKTRTPRTKMKSRTKLRTGGQRTPAKKIPAKYETVGHYQYLETVRRELIDCDAKTLEAKCRDAGIEYRGKMYAIFDIAYQKAMVAYGSEQEGGTVVHEVVGEGMNTGGDSGGNEEVTIDPNHE
ncbi:hypothetical protein CBR_g37435 [Chara braunii]|uniref:CCHC-type domain-containing protein n=1 Tax=Chara braunii TaxID=69332 RepID=A0A388LN49_CHABU|nr:hypothetical protein CBR_g37435 [Chara braunii]|eukprot:GBG83632.1 hypothetical protein CBR_g37435 [Chara braunii]